MQIHTVQITWPSLHYLHTVFFFNEMSNFMSTGQMGNFIFHPAYVVTVVMIFIVNYKEMSRYLLFSTFA